MASNTCKSCGSLFEAGGASGTRSHKTFCSDKCLYDFAHRSRRVIVLDVRDPATGKRKRKWHSFRGTKRQAQIDSARLISELQGGRNLEPTKTTFVQFLDQWLGHIKVHVSPRTHERYTEIIRKNIAPMLGAVQLTKLRPAQIAAAYSEALLDGRKDGSGGLSPNTVLYMHRLIKQALAHAVRWEMISRGRSSNAQLAVVASAEQTGEASATRGRSPAEPAR